MPHAKMTTSIIFLCLLALLSSCASNDIVVRDNVVVDYRSKGISVIAGRNFAGADEKMIKQMEKLLKKQLIRKRRFLESNELQLEFSFFELDKGNRVTRVMWKQFAGEDAAAKLGVAVTYRDAEGNILSEIISRKILTEGFLGGSINELIEPLAYEVVQFTLKNFHPKHNKK